MKKKKFLTVENFFLDPHEMRKWALEQKFYKGEDHPFKDSVGNFPGWRTDFVNNIEPERWRSIVYMVLKACHLYFGKDHEKAHLWISFSYTDSSLKLPGWHSDAIFVAEEFKDFKEKLSGVVYLNEGANPKSGTKIKDGKKDILLENKFNKLVLYPSDIKHTLAGSFGKTKKDARLVCTLLIYLL
tara:strand:+ start:539 stop:1093 length:555 start_codon:yes stop_codon:yes gene_type:complete